MKKGKETKKFLPGEPDDNNEGGDQLHRARITDQQKQQDDAERDFKEKYNERSSKKTRKKRPATKKEEVEEPKSDEAEIGSHQKIKGKKKFFSFLKDLRRRSTWKKIVFNLRNLFRTKASFEEEIHKKPKLTQIRSVFGFKSKAEEKILNMRIAYLLQQLRQLDSQHQTLSGLAKQMMMVRQLIALTTSYLNPPQVQQNRAAAKELLTSQVAQTHSTTIDKQQHRVEQAINNTTVEFNRQFDTTKHQNINSIKHPFAYMLQSARQQPLPIESIVALGVMGMIVTALQAQVAKAINFANDKVQGLVMTGLQSGGLVTFNRVATTHQHCSGGNELRTNAANTEVVILTQSINYTALKAQTTDKMPNYSMDGIMIESQVIGGKVNQY